MSTRHIHKTYPAVPFNVAESQLCRELQAYYEAIHSYPDLFAKTGVSFQAHLLNVMNNAQQQSGGELETLKSAS